ncbi:MAG: filamentous hemagglutinin N-terminal domain-containing protein, partial [Helicobacter sp.]|uniref:filamentous hemagglutinin N-terminal domain-containing protein n=1 Tax=Helicobacter sp. TaxID=218 RepID=UPI002A915EDA
MPSGGKFVNGTGSIATNGNKMDIAGNNKNNVIAWGGGFNIGKEASVNFTTNQKNYLNLDYTNKASQILGKLNGGTNNIYLVNPSGVLIGKDASINANKFGVSTSPFDNNAIQTFSNNGSFSPVFSANKGDIVNMGTISANEIVLVGNRVTNVGNYVDEKGKKQVAFGSFNKKDSLTNTKLEITANHTDLHANGNTIGTIDSITVTAKGNNAKIEVGQSATGWTDVQLGINQNGNVTITTYTSIKDTEDWSSFADIINGGNTNNIDTFKLIKDIDFKDAGAIEPVGNDNSKPFSGNFYGNGHTLSNLLIDADGKNSAGLFGYINGGSVQDLTIDGLNFQGSASVIGGFAGRIDNGTFSNIVLNNIGDISGSSSAGGFAGLGAGTFSNIVLNNIGNISDKVAGGFVGRIRYGTFSNIVLNNIGDISGFNGAGGFAGHIGAGTFSNIALNNIGEINSELNSAGGFASLINNGGTFSNIVFNNIGNISGDHAGGFAGDGSPTSATDIYFYGAMNLIGGNTNQDNINSHNQTALNLAKT